MVLTEHIESKICTLPDLLKRIEFWRKLGDRIVFTNGCFDILHPGHIQLLAGCMQYGDRLIVGLNSDASVKRLKGEQRPLNTEQSRALILAATELTDAISIFEEDTPEKLIEAVKPDALIKGGDWKIEEIKGSKFVQSYGGKVFTVPYLEGYSTTAILSKK